MKKFYESPVVELTGFSAEDVITASGINVIPAEKVTATALGEALAGQYGGSKGMVFEAGADTASYTW